MTNKISRLIGIIMVIVAIGFIVFAINNPQASFPWSNTITYLLYGIYLVATVVMLVAPFKRNK
ncbi:hypothetical protein ACOT7R_16855 [Clostridium perfringens]|uniref:hypothetical protein n=1 Tax=Clostridium perfringens TaxID=1502 RepID=UPI003BAD1881